MYKIYKKNSPNKIRDINIAIAYHNTRRTLKDIALEFKICSARVAGIHHGMVRHISRCKGLDDVYHYNFRKNHSDEMSNYLKEYKKLLENNELRTEITLYDEDKKPAVLICNDGRGEFVNIKLIDNLNEQWISIEDLKLALKKLSAK